MCCWLAATRQLVAYRGHCTYPLPDFDHSTTLLTSHSRLLPRSPDALHKLRAEIGSVVGDAPPTQTDLKKMHYLNLVLKEGPAIPMLKLSALQPLTRHSSSPLPLRPSEFPRGPAHHNPSCRRWCGRKITRLRATRRGRRILRLRHAPPARHLRRGRGRVSA
jgi:hypothetical protein